MRVIKALKDTGVIWIIRVIRVIKDSKLCY
jgi:hypothetical protein